MYIFAGMNTCLVLYKCVFTWQENCGSVAHLPALTSEWQRASGHFSLFALLPPQGCRLVQLAVTCSRLIRWSCMFHLKSHDKICIQACYIVHLCNYNFIQTFSHFFSTFQQCVTQLDTSWTVSSFFPLSAERWLQTEPYGCGGSGRWASDSWVCSPQRPSWTNHLLEKRQSANWWQGW